MSRAISSAIGTAIPAGTSPQWRDPATAAPTKQSGRSRRQMSMLSPNCGMLMFSNVSRSFPSFLNTDGDGAASGPTEAAFPIREQNLTTDHPTVKIARGYPPGGSVDNSDCMASLSHAKRLKGALRRTCRYRLRSFFPCPAAQPPGHPGGRVASRPAGWAASTIACRNIVGGRKFTDGDSKCCGRRIACRNIVGGRKFTDGDSKCCGRRIACRNIVGGREFTDRSSRMERLRCIILRVRRRRPQSPCGCAPGWTASGARTRGASGPGPSAPGTRRGP